MRILYLNCLFSPYIGGGAEITIESIARGMKAQGHEVAVVTTHDKPITEISVIDGLRIYRIGIRNIYWPYSAQSPSSIKRALWHLFDIYNFSMQTPLADAVDDFQPEIVSIHNLPGISISAYSVFGKRGIPIVQVLHDYYLICPSVNLYSGGKVCVKRCTQCRAFRAFHASLTNRVDAVVGVSQAVLQQHLDHGAFAKVTRKIVINNARKLSQQYEEHFVDRSARILGYIGTISEVKGLESLIDSFLIVQKRIATKIKLRIGGTGSEAYVDFLKDKYAESDIEFLGRVVPSRFFAEIDINIVPSLWLDPLPGVVFESLGYGVPVIGAAKGGIPEMVVDGVNGLLYDPDAPSGLTEAIEKLVLTDGLIDKFKKSALLSVARFLNMDRMLSEYNSLYSSVLLENTKSLHHE